MRALAILVAASAAGCGDDLAYAFADVAQVTSETPLAPGCNTAPQVGQLVASSEVEPMVAVDPTHPRHLVGAWQQDRWTTGGSNGTLSGVSDDGGRTWTYSHAQFSRCTGAAPGSPGDYERATDPWVTFGPSGIAWQIALSFDKTTARNAILAARSDDGGATWSEPTALIADDDPDVFNDKDAVTADPTDPGRVFAVWDRLTGQTMPTMPIGTGPAMMARAENSVWEPARAIYDPGVDAQTIGNVIVVLPDGTVVDVFQHITMMSSPNPQAEVDAIRSIDHGTTWSAPVKIGNVAQNGVVDPGNGVYVRGGGLPAIAADPVSGQIYVAWEGTFDQADGVYWATSTDGGQTWTTLTQLIQGDEQRFTPAVAVGTDGAVAISYYGTRDAAAGGADRFDVAAFLSTSRDHGQTWTEERLTGPFDLRQALVGDVYFLGDYQGLVPDGDQIVPFFSAAVAAPQDPSDIFVRPVT
jgi:hypothetical protein